MKNILLLAALLCVGLIPHKAHAQVAAAAPVCFPFGCGGASLAGMSVGSNVGGMLGAAAVVWLFPYLNTTGERPFEEAFGVNNVEYSYPQDPNGYSEAYAHMRPAQVRRVVQHDQLYIYQNETGVHPPKGI